jgi:pectate lyase
MGVKTTTGGAGGSTIKATTLAQLNTAAAGTNAAIIEISGHLNGSVTIGSNKTLVGSAGAVIEGHVELKGSVNVIVRNLTVVGYNCSDNSDCQSGADAITVEQSAHHIWFDHDDVSDGSDGNLDITHASDYVTISWTKFHYSGTRAGGHQFSTLIGHSDDNDAEDTGHLKVTFHHDWWADHVGERMPRARFGQVHVFNNLFTSVGDNYCIRVGKAVQILDENNAFVGIANPIDLYDATGKILSRGDLYQNVTGTMQDTGSAFTPPYAYQATAASAVQTAVTSGAGPH